jgi:subtilisin family serine protease
MIKRHLPLLLIVFACALLLIPQAKVYSQKSAKTNSGYVARQILIKLKTDAQLSSYIPQSTTEAAQVPQSIDGQQVARELLPEIGINAEMLGGALQNNLFLVEFNENVSVEEAIQRAQSDPRVAYAEPDKLIEPSVIPNDSRFGEMWSLLNNDIFGKAGADISATRAWDLTTGSNDVVVAITDTGVDIGHQDLAANIWVNPNEIAGNGIDDDSNGFIDDVNGWNFKDDNKTVFNSIDGDFHGTFVSGVVGAVGNNEIGVTGVAWQVKLMPLKFISEGSGSISGAIKAINYAVAQKKKGINIRAINASWGPGRSDCADSFSASLKDAIVAAGNQNILFVSSAGNGVCGTSSGDNMDTAPEYPAAWSGELSNAISVAAVDKTDAVPFWSNYGHQNVGVAAPGVSVLSTVPRGYVGLPDVASYVPDSGTSFAAPYVTGIAALLAVREPSLTATQIKQRIISTVEPLLPLASKVAGSGRVNAYNALTNQVAPIAPLAVNSIQVSKKFADIDGLGFVQGAMVVEINGVPFGNTKYDGTYTMANGSFTRIFVKAPKPDMRAAFPVGVPVNVTVFNKNTGVRSPVFTFTQR